MNSEQALFDLLDRYVKGALETSEKEAFEERMKNDALFREKAEQHFALVKELKFYGDRTQLQNILNKEHDILEPLPVRFAEKTGIRKYWPMISIAASVAVICIAGTVFFTQRLESEQTANYRELRRNVDQIRKSQKIIMEDLAETKEKVLPGKYAGTGFLLSAKGYVATSYHVVKESDSIVIENEKFGRLRTKVIYSDPANDISILKIEAPFMLRSLPYTIADSEASLAEDVYTLGFPREDVVFGEGAISAHTGFNQNPNAYQISVPVNPGNSGGPLLNSKGDLIGMISGFQTQTSGAAFAIKSAILLDAITNPALDTLTIPLIVSKQNILKNASRVQQVKQWTDFVFMVQVYKN
jgi:S1-C subfamily serine protease